MCCMIYYFSGLYNKNIKHRVINNKQKINITFHSTETEEFKFKV